MIAQEPSILSPLSWQVLTSVLLFVLAGVAAAAAYKPALRWVLRQEARFEVVLQQKLLLDLRGRTLTLGTAAGAVLLGLGGYVMLRGNVVGMLLGAAAAGAIPRVVLWFLQRRRREKLESQLVGGIRTLTSGVRAGLNLVQSMQLVAGDGPLPLRQEITHLLREYEYGLPLEEAMDNAVARIGSGDFALLFAALQTHRERGGDLGNTLDRIGNSILEIQRLENRVKTLTAEGRVSARFLGSMPLAVLAVLYFFVDRDAVVKLFSDPMGNVFLLVIVVLNVAGFLWIRKILSVDI